LGSTEFPELATKSLMGAHWFERVMLRVYPEVLIAEAARTTVASAVALLPDEQYVEVVWYSLEVPMDLMRSCSKFRGFSLRRVSRCVSRAVKSGHRKPRRPGSRYWEIVGQSKQLPFMGNGRAMAQARRGLCIPCGHGDAATAEGLPGGDS